MNTLWTGLRNFLVEEDGPTAVEYAIMLALIIVTVMIAVYTVGTTTCTMMDDVALKNSLSNSAS